MLPQISIFYLINWILLRKLFKGGNYTDAETICGNAVCCKKGTISGKKSSKQFIQIVLFSFEPKTQQNYSLISALASKKRSDEINKGTLSTN